MPEISAEMEHLGEEAKNELADIKAELEAQAPPLIQVENGPIAVKPGSDGKENEKKETACIKFSMQ